MADAGNVLGCCSVLHGQHSLVDQLAGVGSDDVGSQDLVGGLVGQNLDETVSLVVGLLITIAMFPRLKSQLW